MNRIFSALLLCSFAFTVAPDPYKLIGKKVPELSVYSLDSQFIDSNFFKGKVTLIYFFEIGCAPCIKESRDVPKLLNLFKDSGFQVLGIAAQSRERLKKYNSDDDTLLGKLRQEWKIEKFSYPVIAECPKEKPVKINGESIRLGYECRIISKKFKVNGFPNNFFVDRNGLIRFVNDGYVIGNTDLIISKFKSQISYLLNE